MTLLRTEAGKDLHFQFGRVGSAALSQPPIIVWFRQDLRLQDNPALHAALLAGRDVVPVYILDEAGEERWPLGAASRWWLHHSLAALAGNLRENGLSLRLVRGDSGERLQHLVRETGADTIHWARRYEPASRRRDAQLQAAFTKAGLVVKEFGGGLLHEPTTVANQQGNPFQVFTPFWRHCQTLPVEAPLKRPSLKIKDAPVDSSPPGLADLGLLPRRDWAAGFTVMGQPGEGAARAKLKQFVRGAMAHYAEHRNFPGTAGTSQLSPALHFGEISPRQVWAAIKSLSVASGVFPPGRGAQVFLNEIGWRDFAYHLLYHYPHTPLQPLRGEFARFAWADDPDGILLRAWQQGRTGYPIVDASMRQLWRTGWMHNRMRMVTASFLVKHLRLSWTHGADWFWDTLVDADLASNTFGWQWSAGCGADAAPYFRIFAPVLQGKKFDADGKFVRTWVPELAGLPDRYLHAPWEAPPEVLTAAGVELGENYPRPVVDHAAARAAALAAFKNRH